MIILFDTFKKRLGSYIIRTRIINDKGIVQGKCSITVTNNVWTISEWFIDKTLQGKGIGRALLRSTLEYLYNVLGEPLKIEYIWNGQNEYVLEWLTRNFEPISKCPLSVQKTQTEDDWESHVYVLDKNKVLKYFRLI